MTMTLRHRSKNRSCRGLAAVELALLLPLLLVFLVGVWEVGRLIQVQQILTNATREGARVAAQGLTINLSNEPTEITSTDVEDTVINYLREANVSTNNVTIAFAFVNGNTTFVHPHEAAKNQRYTITTTLPFNNVRWTFLSLTNVQQMQATVAWESLVDDPFVLSTNVPSW